MALRDWRGSEVNIGDTVVYPSREGSKMWMTEGEVVTVNVKLKKVGVLKHGGRRLAYPAFERITVM